LERLFIYSLPALSKVKQMGWYEEKLKNFISDNGIKCKHMHFEQSCHSV